MSCLAMSQPLIRRFLLPQARQDPLTDRFDLQIGPDTNLAMNKERAGRLMQMR